MLSSTFPLVIQLPSTMYHTHHTRDNKMIERLLALTYNACTQCPQQLKAQWIFGLKHMVDFVVRRFTLFFRVALVIAVACLHSRFRFKLIGQYRISLIIVNIFYLNSRKPPNSSPEVRNRDIRIIKYICCFDSPLHLTSHSS